MPPQIPTKTCRSDGWGSEHSPYVVLDARSGAPVSGVLILFVEFHEELIPVLRELGYDTWADEQERKWKDIKKDKK